MFGWPWRAVPIPPDARRFASKSYSKTKRCTATSTRSASSPIFSYRRLLQARAPHRDPHHLHPAAPIADEPRRSLFEAGRSVGCDEPAGLFLALLELLHLDLLELAQPRVDRGQRVEIAVAGGLGELQLLDRGGHAALQIVGLGERPGLLGARAERGVGLGGGRGGGRCGPPRRGSCPPRRGRPRPP